MNDKKIIRVVFYIRVSTEEQKIHGLSLDAQLLKLNEYTEKHNYHLVGEYRDEGVSGRKEIKKRPQLQKMLKDAQKDMFDLILFIKLDRYFRSVAEYHECQKILDKYDVKWTATEEKYDLTTANGRAFVNMKLTIAELEADQTSERIKIVNDFKVKEGYAVNGSVPFGWVVVRKGNHSFVEKDPTKQHIIMEAIEHFETFKMINKTITYIQEKYDIRHTYKVLRAIFDSHLLYGSYRDNDNYCEPYITKERFDKIQEMLSKNFRQVKWRTYLFSNLIKCGDCGSTMCGNYKTYITKKGPKESYTYKCNYRMKLIKCEGKCISEKRLEKYLIKHIKEEIEKYIVNIQVKAKEHKPVRVNINAIQKEMNRLNIQYRKGRIDDKEYDFEYEKLEAKIKKAKESIKTSERDISHLKKILESDFETIYHSLDREHKKAFWNSIIEKITVYEKEKITITLKA